MNADTMYNVKNRTDGMIVYSIPEYNIRREFAPGETKKLKHFELEQLSYRPGGRRLMSHYLQIDSAEALDDLGVTTQPEYFLNEQQIIELMKTGSLDSFLDCLDFAPDGVINLIKKYSVELPMTDTQKRRALKAKTGFDVDAAVRNNEPDITPEESKASSQRRVQPDEAPEGRRTTPPKYNVTNRQ